MRWSSLFVPTGFLVSRRTFRMTPFIWFRLQEFHLLRLFFPKSFVYHISVVVMSGSSNFARHYFRNRFCFLFLRVLRCFSSPGSPCIPIYSICNNTMLLVLSSLIRISADLKIFAPPRSFSQLVTSFFGAMYQGILRKPFVAWSFSFIYSSLLFFNRKFYYLYSTTLISWLISYVFVLTFR